VEPWYLHYIGKYLQWPK